jgi:hypothetical protein
LILVATVAQPVAAGEKPRLGKFEGWVVSEPCAKKNVKAESMDWAAACDPETEPWVLWVDKRNRHEFLNPDQVKDVFGKKVRLIGTMNEDGKIQSGTAVEIE